MKINFLRINPVNFRFFAVRFSFLLIIVLTLQWANKADAAAHLDDTFGASGKVITKIGTYETVVYDTAIQPDGKIVTAGFTLDNGENNFFIVVRYNPDGTLDNSFDGDGIVKAQFRITGTQYLSNAYAVKIQADGKIVVAGISSVLVGGAGSVDFGVARLNPDGSFDTSFGVNGTTTVSLGQQYDNLQTMDIQPDGKILLAGSTSNNSQARGYPVIARLDQRGALDPTFSNDGVIIYTNEIFGITGTILSQPDGKILLVIIDDAVNILRYNSDGSADTSFGTNGSVINSFRGATSAALQPDGKILLGGTNQTANTDFIIYRYNPNGSLDTTFNNIGTTAVSFGDYYDSLRDIAVQPDGKIVAVGYSDPSSQIDIVNFAAARLNPNGSLDTTFDLDGKIITPISSASSAARAVAVQSNGKIVVAGSVYISPNPGRGDAALVRYMGDIKTADFDGDTKTDISVWRPSNGYWYFMKSSGGNGGVLWGLSSDKPVPGDYTGDGKTDVAVFRPSTGQWFILRSENSTYYAVSFGESTDVPAPADYDGDGRTDIGVFRPSNGYWYQLRSGSNNQFVAQQFGQNGDKPVPGDFDGDGLGDKAVYRNGNWYIAPSATNSFRAVLFGNPNDRPLSGDFDGDGKTDIAVFRPDANGNAAAFYISQSSDSAFKAVSFGVVIDIPVIGDYDGDGKSDIAVFRPSNGAWYLNRSSQGLTGLVFGQTVDKPIPASYLPDNSFQINRQ